MESNPFDLADEFCRLVGAPSLLDYLGVTNDSSPADVQEKLKARRKHMQGMQSNPKYKQEALFLIKHFAALSDAVNDPRLYADDVQRRAESGHLQVLEMTIRGMLAGNAGRPLTVEQEQFLRKNARELRVSERSYERLLRRLGVETGVELPLPPPTPSMVPGPSPMHDTSRISAERLPPAVDPGATTAVEAVPPERRAPPAPPEKRRSSESETAPPVRPRTQGPRGAAPRLEVQGATRHRVTLGQTEPIRLTIRNLGDGPMPGTIDVEAPWLIPVQPRLDPTAATQVIELRLAPGLLVAGSVGIIEIDAESAGNARIEVEVVAAPRLNPALAGAGAALLLLFALLAWAWLRIPPAPTRLVVHVDPLGSVIVNGQAIGAGTTVSQADPPTGRIDLEVQGNANFTPWTQSIDVAGAGTTEIEVRLELAHAISSFPAGEAGPCPDAETRHAIGERLPALKRCIASINGTVKAAVRFGAEGIPVGMDLDVKDLPTPTTACIERNIAAMSVATPSACLVSFEIPRP